MASNSKYRIWRKGSNIVPAVVRALKERSAEYDGWTTAKDLSYHASKYMSKYASVSSRQVAHVLTVLKS